jgi:hypothetical protein
MVNCDHAPPAPAWLAARTQPHCLLCDGPAAFSNIYIPGERSPAAPPAGKHRLVFYSLCQSCAANFEVLSSLIETKIENELRHRGAI